jgi:hypothetical protein
MLTSEWHVPAGGFQWAERYAMAPDGISLGSSAMGKVGTYLVPVTDSGGKQYDVFSDPALFRKFAKVTPTQDGVLDFANQYGFLGAGCLQRIWEPDVSKPTQFWPAHGEQLPDWIREIHLIRHAVIDLWDNIRDGHAASLKAFIHWESIRDGSRVLYLGPQIPGYRRLSFCLAKLKTGQPLPEFRNGDLLRPAWSALLRIANEQLVRHPVTGRIAESSDAHPAARFTISAGSLISALWLQLARAIADNPQFRQCEECGDDFEISTDRRADARFCTDACRLRAHRKRTQGKK